MKELIEKWLSLFGSPWVFSFKDLKWMKDEIPNITTKYNQLESLIKVNDEHPYGIHFSPNWNFWLLNTVWQPIVRKKEDANAYISCFYIDVDRRDSSFKMDSDNSNLLKYIISFIEEIKLRVSFISETPWWFHLWMFIHPDDREYLWRLISNDEYKLVQEDLASRLDWWDKNSHWISKLMRLPFSNHWKTWIPERVKLYTTNIEEIRDEQGWTRKVHLKEVKSVDDIVVPESMYARRWGIITFVKTLKKNLNIEDRLATVDTIGTLMWDWETQINSLNIIDVVKKLYDYPREYHNKMYRFVLDWLGISLEYDWIKHHTDWYKINREQNYVNNFSTTNHNKYERPTWWPYWFLRRYFNNNILKIKDFVVNEFWLELSNWDSWVFWTYIANNWTYLFTADWIIFESNISKKWEDTRQVIIQRPIAIKWAIETKTQSFWEEEQTRRQYIFYDTKNDSEYLVEFQADTRKFNSNYWSYWLILTTNSASILLNLFVALNSALERWEIYKYDCRELNGYYDDMFVVWDTAYDMNGDEINNEELWLLLRTKKIITQPTGTEITVSEFWEKFSKLFSAREALVWFTTFIALLLWNKFREPILRWYKQQVLIPWLFLSWVSRSWKTTALTIFKNWFGLAYETKKYSIISTTPQPLKQEATDDFILHLEEFTWDVWEVKETIVRDILNKTRTSRWEMDGSNVSYNSRSQLILDWEVLPESESVTNRCIMIPMFLQDRIGNEETLWDIMKYSYRTNFLQLAYRIDKSKAIDDFKQSEETLKKAWIRDRNLLLYSFLLTTNRWFNIFFENELIDAIMSNVTQQALMDKDTSILSDIMADIIIKYRIRPTVWYLEWEDWMVDTESKVVNITYTADFKKKYKTYFIWAQKEFWDYRVRFTPNAIKLVYDPKDDSDINKKLYTIIMNFYQYYNITNDIISW